MGRVMIRIVFTFMCSDRLDALRMYERIGGTKRKLNNCGRDCSTTFATAVWCW